MSERAIVGDSERDRLRGQEGETKMKMWKILTLAIAMVSIGVPIVAGIATWLSPAVIAGVFTLTPHVAVAVALVLYFNWRARFTRQILGNE
jgi:hypothetical protein